MNMYVGKICPYCKTLFKQDDTVAVCNSCFMPHHLACWQANEGCTTYGCTGLIDTIINQENATKQAVPSNPQSAEQQSNPPKTSNGPGKFEAIFESTEGKLQANVPVLIEKFTLIKKTADDSIFARCTFRSLTDKPIKALLLDVVATDAWGNAAEGVEGFQLLDLKTKREAEFGQTTPIPIPNKNVRSIDVVIKKILYEDRSMEDCDGSYTTVPMQTSLLTTLGMKEAVEKYAEMTTKAAKFVPVVGQEVWRCTCGAINTVGNDICYSCQSSLAAQQAAYQPEQIIAETKAFLEEKRRKEEEIRLAREKEQREAEERLRKVQEEKERQEREAKEAKKDKKKKIIKRTIISIVSLILVAVIGYGTIFHLVPLIRYNMAASKVEKLEFDSAYNTYIALKDYKDCPEKATETLYKKATYLEGQEQFVEAAVEYEKVLNYQDSKTKATYCRNEANYRDAKAKFDAKDYDGAIAAFAALGDYSESKDWVNKTNYEIAKGNYEKCNYSEAYDQFTALGDFEDSKVQANESMYMMAETALDAKDYQTAYKYYNALGKKYKDCNEKARKAKYLYAGDCMIQKKYKEANDIYGTLKSWDYEDSEAKYIESAYLYAKSCYDSKNYVDAVTYFIRAGDYEDSLDLLKDSKYENALKLISSKEYTKAINILKDLGNYKRSKTKINEAKYAYVKANKNNTNTTTYSYLKDLKAAGYSDSSQIYNELYQWSATVKINNGASSVKYYARTDVEINIMGGEPNGTKEVRYIITYPNGDLEYGDWEIITSRGERFSFYWDSGCMKNLYEDAVLNVIVVDKSGNTLGSSSIIVKI